MQDVAPAGFAWGGGYIACISLHPDENVATNRSAVSSGGRLGKSRAGRPEISS